tara:strand:+ start:3081 stop:3302 length:222 start_codon:yes stop_codon:yes gene_type:complete
MIFKNSFLIGNRYIESQEDLNAVFINERDIEELIKNGNISLDKKAPETINKKMPKSSNKKKETEENKDEKGDE